MREEKRPSKFGAEGQGNPAILLAVLELAALDPTLMIDAGGDGVSGRRRSQNIGDQAFVPTLDPMVIFLLGSRVAMPEQDVGAFCVPVPVHLSPKVVDAGAE